MQHIPGHISVIRVFATFAPNVARVMVLGPTGKTLESMEFSGSTADAQHDSYDELAEWIGAWEMETVSISHDAGPFHIREELLELFPHVPTQPVVPEHVWLYRQNNVRGVYEGPKSVWVVAPTATLARDMALEHKRIANKDYCSCCGPRWEPNYPRKELLRDVSLSEGQIAELLRYKTEVFPMSDVPAFVRPESNRDYKTTFQMWLRRHPVAREKWTRLDSLRDKLDLAVSHRAMTLTEDDRGEYTTLCRWFEGHNVRIVVAAVALGSR